MTATTPTSSGTGAPAYTVPGIDPAAARTVIAVLQDRLVATIDLQLTLKHVHWNLVGPTFIAVHQMLDPQVDLVREMSDEIAERIATLGGVPLGTPGAVVSQRRWDEYALGRDSVANHLGALQAVYAGVVADHRKAADETEKVDVVTNDLLVGHLHQLEKFHWFLRAHLEDPAGGLHDPRHESV